MALKNDGTVWTCGANWQGMLGNGTNNHSYTPVQVVNLTDVIAVASGNVHCIALKNDQTVWTWGYNLYGNLGDGTNVNSNVPVLVSGLSGVVAIGAGEDARCSFAVKNDGTLWSWGENSKGQLGDGTLINRNVPVMVPGLSGIMAVSAGWGHAMALQNDGTVWTWGMNNAGQLGHGNTTDSPTPIHVSNFDNVATVVCGGEHSLAKWNDGSVWAWGNNYSGQLGDGTNVNRSLPEQVIGLCQDTVTSANEPQTSGLSANIHEENLSVIGTAEGGTLIVWSVEGKELLRQVTTSGATSVSIPNLAAGCYMIRYVDANRNESMRVLRF
jgi:alpha-tubulin suppressor-like RCC1 family protein